MNAIDVMLWAAAHLWGGMNYGIVFCRRHWNGHAMLPSWCGWLIFFSCLAHSP